MQEDTITSYNIPYALPLQFNTSVDVLTQLNEHEEIVRQLVLTEEESKLLKTLLENLSCYCTYEDMLQAISSDGEAITMTKQPNHDGPSSALGPIRRTLSNLKTKLDPFGVTILALYETDYLITALRSHERKGEKSSFPLNPVGDVSLEYARGL